MKSSLKISIAGLFGGITGWFLLSYLAGLPILAGIMIGAFAGVLEYGISAKVMSIFGFKDENRDDQSLL